MLNFDIICRWRPEPRNSSHVCIHFLSVGRFRRSLLFLTFVTSSFQASLLGSDEACIGFLLGRSTYAIRIIFITSTKRNAKSKIDAFQEYAESCCDKTKCDKNNSLPPLLMEPLNAVLSGNRLCASPRTLLRYATSLIYGVTTPSYIDISPAPAFLCSAGNHCFVDMGVTRRVE